MKTEVQIPSVLETEGFNNLIKQWEMLNELLRSKQVSYYIYAISKYSVICMLVIIKIIEDYVDIRSNLPELYIGWENKQKTKDFKQV